MMTDFDILEGIDTFLFVKNTVFSVQLHKRKHTKESTNTS